MVPIGQAPRFSAWFVQSGIPASRPIGPIGLHSRPVRQHANGPHEQERCANGQSQPGRAGNNDLPTRPWGLLRFSSLKAIRVHIQPFVWWTLKTYLESPRNDGGPHFFVIRRPEVAELSPRRKSRLARVREIPLLPAKLFPMGQQRSKARVVDGYVIGASRSRLCTHW